MSTQMMELNDSLKADVDRIVHLNGNSNVPIFNNSAMLRGAQGFTLDLSMASIDSSAVGSRLTTGLTGALLSTPTQIQSALKTNSELHREVQGLKVKLSQQIERNAGAAEYNALKTTVSGQAREVENQKGVIFFGFIALLVVVASMALSMMLFHIDQSNTKNGQQDMIDKLESQITDDRSRYDELLLRYHDDAAAVNAKTDK